jgi:hypothetical protein
MNRRIERLREMSGREVSWRLSAACRTAAQRVMVQGRRPGWNRNHLAGALAPEALAGPIGAAVAAKDWPAVHDRLAAGIKARGTRFVLDPESASRLRLAILARWPHAAQDATRHADQILAGRYDLLGYTDVACGVDGSGVEVDWHRDAVHGRSAPQRFWADVPFLDPSIGDHKVIWELNRHQHWLQLGRALWLTGSGRYGRGIASHLESWLATNPPLVGINWASMLEIGFRAISWTWAIHFLLGSDSELLLGSDSELLLGSDAEPGADSAAPRSPWLVDILVALDRQMSHLEQNLSYYFSPNTHLTGEALALYTVGMALPELAASARWASTGRRILLAEAERQIEPDGGHVERSTHYQRYTLDFYLFALLIAERTGDREAAVPLRDIVTRLAECTRLLANDAGRLPLIGDDDGGMLWPIAGRACSDVRDSLATAALVLDRPDLAPWGVTEEAIWLAAPLALDRGGSTKQDPPYATVRSRLLPETGYIVMRDDAGGHAVFDAGPHGFAKGGHAHADALSIAMTLDHHPLLIDPGTSTYTIDPSLRDALRATKSHNTVTVDGRSQSIPDGPFGWQTRADSQVVGWTSNPAFDWAVASHDGYAPVHHRRSVVRTAGGWLIADELTGSGAHTASAHWHIDPAWTLRHDSPGRIRATHTDGASAWLLYDGGSVSYGRGDAETGLGWWAPAYGQLLPAWTVRVTKEGMDRLSFVTWIGMWGPPSGGPTAAPVLERLSPAGDERVAARVRHSDAVSTFLLAPGGASAERRPWSEGCYRTDARMLRGTETAGRVLSLDLADATYADAGDISVESDDPIHDLNVTLCEDTLSLSATVIPAELRLHGSAVTQIAKLRLNGHLLPSGPERANICIVGPQWTELDRRVCDHLDSSPRLLRLA